MSCDDYCNNFGCNQSPGCLARETPWPFSQQPIKDATPPPLNPWPKRYDPDAEEALW